MLFMVRFHSQAMCQRRASECRGGRGVGKVEAGILMKSKFPLCSPLECTINRPCRRASAPADALGAAGLAQLVEQLICNHQVAGSIPAAGTIQTNAAATARRLLFALTVALILPGPKAGALAQDGEPAPTFEQAQARTQYARSRMEAAQRKVLSLERKEKAAYEKLTDAQKRYEEAKVAADSATEDLRAAQGEHEEATRRYEQESAQLRRIYLDNEARRKQRSN